MIWRHRQNLVHRNGGRRCSGPRAPLSTRNGRASGPTTTLRTRGSSRGIVVEQRRHAVQHRDAMCLQEVGELVPARGGRIGRRPRRGKAGEFTRPGVGPDHPARSRLLRLRMPGARHQNARGQQDCGACVAQDVRDAFGWGRGVERHERRPGLAHAQEPRRTCPQTAVAGQPREYPCRRPHGAGSGPPGWRVRRDRRTSDAAHRIPGRRPTVCGHRRLERSGAADGPCLSRFGRRSLQPERQAGPRCGRP